MAVMNSVPLEEEMDKNLSLREKDLNSLKRWCLRQFHLPLISDSDFALFLHNSHYCVEAAKRKIENFFTMRTYMPEFFTDCDPVFSLSLRKIFKTVSIIPLDNPTPEGHRIILAKLIDSDANNYTFSDAVKFLNMVLDICIYEGGTNNGFVFVFDLNGATIKHSTRLNFIALKRFFDYYRKAAPIRWKGLHYINTSPKLDRIQQFVKSKIVNKFVDSLYFHSSLESFHEVIPAATLPNELGGKAGSLMELHQKVIEKLVNYRQWFLVKESQMQINNFMFDEYESKYQTAALIDLFGPRGNIAHLEVD